MTDQARQEQILVEFLVKAAQLIIQARQVDAPLSQTKTNRWFNLEVAESEPARLQLDARRKGLCAPDASPLVLEVTLERPGHAPIVVEQWHLRYDHKSATQPAGPSSPSVGGRRAAGPGGLGEESARALEVPVVYKRTVILLRSMYSLLRMLPAHRLFRACKRSQGAAANLTCCILPESCTPTDLSADPTAAAQLAEFKPTPVATARGSLSARVVYRRNGAVTALALVAPPPLPKIIYDYVNSPTGPQQYHHSHPHAPHRAGRDAESANRRDHRAGSQPPRTHRQSEPVGVPQRLSGFERVASTPLEKLTRKLGSVPVSLLTSTLSGSPATLAARPPAHSTALPSGSAVQTHDGLSKPNFPTEQVESTSAPSAMPRMLRKQASAPPLASAGAGGVRGVGGGHVQRDNPPVGGASHISRACTSQGGSNRSTSSSYLSGSPNFPFAFTPTQNAASSASSVVHFLGHSEGMPLSGNELPPLALARRPSWSPSSSFNVNATAVCSISPLHDGSTSSLVYSPDSLPGIHGGTIHPNTKTENPYGPLRLTFRPKERPSEEEEPADFEDLDALPFALDGDGGSPVGSSASAAEAASEPVTASRRGQGGSGGDVAVGALIRMLQDAPRLRPGPRRRSVLEEELAVEGEQVEQVGCDNEDLSKSQPLTRPLAAVLKDLQRFTEFRDELLQQLGEERDD